MPNDGQFAPPDFTRQEEFDSASLQLAAKTLDEFSQRALSAGHASEALSKGLEAMKRMSQSAVDGGLDLLDVYKQQSVYVYKVSQAVSESNLSLKDQSRLQKILHQSIKGYVGQMSRAIDLRMKSAKASGRERAAVQNEIRVLKGYKDEISSVTGQVRQFVKEKQRAAQRGGTMKSLADFKRNAGNILDARSRDTSGLTGGFRSKVNTAIKNALHTSGAWQSGPWGTLDTKDLTRNWKTVAASATVFGAAFTKAFADVSNKFESLDTSIAQFKNSMAEASRAMGMVDTAPLENMRESLRLARTQATQLFQVMAQGMSETGKSSEELSRVAKVLKDTFGGDITDKLKSYIDLIKTIPTLQEDLTTGSFEDKSASLYALASSGKASELNALMPTGLFGGEQKRQPGADKLDWAQSAQYRSEKLGEFLMHILPNMSSYMAQIPGMLSEITSLAAGVATVIGSFRAAALVAWHRQAIQNQKDDVEDTLENAARKAQINTFQLSNTAENHAIISAIAGSSGGKSIDSKFYRRLARPSAPSAESAGSEAAAGAETAAGAGPKVPKVKTPSAPAAGASGTAAAGTGAAGAGGGSGAAAAGSGGTLAAGSAAAIGVGAGIALIGAGIIAGSKYYKNKSHARAERQIEEGDFTGAKESLASSSSTNKWGTSLGGMAVGAGLGLAVGGPVGALIGGTIGLIGGYIQSAAESAAENKKLLDEIARYEKQNLEEFGTAIIPATQGKADFDKLRAQSTELLNARAKNLARSAKFLEDALGELKNGVNSAKLQFFKLQQDLSSLKLQQADLLGLNADSVKATIGMQLGAARGTYDTKMRAVERARTRAATDTKMDPEARAALSAQAEKEATAALLEFAKATMEAAESIRKLPEYMMNSMKMESLEDMFTNGLLNEDEIGSMFDMSMEGWKKSLEEARRVFDEKSKAIETATEIGRSSAVKNISGIANSVKNAKRPDKPFLSDADKENAIAMRDRLIAENARQKSWASSWGGGLSDKLTAEEQKAWDKRGGGGIGAWMLRRLPDWVSFNRRNDIDENNKVIDEINEKLFAAGAGGNAGRASYQFAQKYGSRFQDLVVKDQNGKDTLDVDKAETLRDDIQKELDAKRAQLEGMAGGQDMLNIREMENNKKRQRELAKQREEAMRNGDTDAAEEAGRQIRILQDQMTGELIPSLNTLFSGAGLNEEQQKKAADYLATNGFDRFLQALEAGKSDEIFGVTDGKGVAAGIITQLKTNIGKLTEADRIAAEVAELSGKVDQLNTGIEASGNNEKAMLDLERQQMMEVRKANDAQIKKLSQMAKGIGDNTNVLRHMVEVRQNEATAASVSGTGMDAYGKAWDARLAEVEASNKAAAEAIEKGPGMVEQLHGQVDEADKNEKAAKKVLEDMTSEFEAKYGGGKELSDDEQKAADKLANRIKTAEASYTQKAAQTAVLKQQELEAQKSITDASKTLAENAKKTQNYIAEVDRIISAGLESGVGLVGKAMAEEAEAAFDAADFAENITAAAHEAAEIGIVAAEKRAQAEREAVENSAKRLGEVAKQAGDAAYKFAYASEKARLKKENPNMSDADIEKQATSYAEGERRKTVDLTTEQGIHKVRAAGLAVETRLKKERLKQRDEEKRKLMEIKDIQLQSVDAYRDFAENFGGSWSEVYQLQNMSVQIEREKLEIAKQNLEEAKAAGASGKKLLERQQEVFMQEINVRKKEIGVAKSMMDRMIGAAFGQIRQSFGAKQQMGTVQHLMGVQNTRMRRADGTYGPGDGKTIEQRQFERQVNGAFGTSQASAADMAANVMKDSSQIFSDSTTIFSQSVDRLNEMLNNMFNPSTDRNAEAEMWLKALINSLPHHASGTKHTKKGAMVVGELGTEIVYSPGGETVIPHNSLSEVDINALIETAQKDASYLSNQQAIDDARAREEAAASVTADNDPWGARNAYLEQARRENKALKDKYTRWNEANYRRSLENKAKNEAARAAGKESNLPEDFPDLRSARADARQKEIEQYGDELMLHDRQQERENLERAEAAAQDRRSRALSYLYPTEDRGLRGTFTAFDQQQAIKNHPNRPLTDEEKKIIAKNMRDAQDRRVMNDLAKVSASRQDKRSTAAFTTGDGVIHTMDSWNAQKKAAENKANPLANSNLTPEQIKQNRELVRMLAMGHAAKEMRAGTKQGHITTVAERMAGMKSYGGMGATRQSLGGPVQNGFVGYNGSIDSFQGYNGSIDSFQGAKAQTQWIRGEDGLLYNPDGSRANAQTDWVGGRPGKRMNPVGGLKRDEHGKLTGVSDVKSGMNKSQKAHPNQWTGVTSANSNAPGVAAAGSGGGGGASLSGKVSGEVTVKFDPPILEQAIAPVVMDVVLNNINKIENLLLG